MTAPAMPPLYSALRHLCFPGRPILLLILLLFLPPNGAWARQEESRFTGRVTEVMAGDTLRIRLDAWEVTVRLHGVDAPKSSETFRSLARDYAARRTLNTDVTVQVQGTGSREVVYGEVMTTAGKSLNQELVGVGLGVWSRQYAPHREDLKLIEEMARADRRGLWGNASVALPPFAYKTQEQEKARRTAEARAKEEARKKALAEAKAEVDAAAKAGADAEARLKIEAAARAKAEREAALAKADAVAARQTPPTAAATVPPPRVERRAAAVRAAPRAQSAGSGGHIGRPYRAAVPAAVLVFAASLFLLTRASGAGWNVRSLWAQVIVSVLMAAAAGMVFAPLLLLLMRSPSGGFAALTPGERAAILLTPLSLLCGWGAARIGRQERILRATPLSSPDDAMEGLTRLKGITSGSLGIVRSVTGHIPGIYVREVVSRYDEYDAEDDGKGGLRRVSGKRGPLRWRTVRDETRAADFLLSDGEEAVVVEAGALAGNGTFYPFHTARFYNDLPVKQRWTQGFKPSVGDIRSEVLFIPPEASLTVWGRFYRTADPLPERIENRIGYDALRRCFIVVEGDERRVQSYRSAVSLLLGALSVLMASAVAYCLFAPKAFSL